MEIIIKFDPFYVFCDVAENPYAFFESVCEKLSEKSICEALGVIPSEITAPEKEKIINDISNLDHMVCLSFEIDESQRVDDGMNIHGFMIKAQQGADGYYFFRAAVIFEIMGLLDLCHSMRMEFYSRVANDMFQDRISKEIEKGVMSNVNRKKASKPRNKHHGEVMSVIKATWDKYPAAPKTGILDELAVHYHRKVSRNALNNWIDASGLRPPKPEKYSSFQLVFPPITG